MILNISIPELSYDELIIATENWDIKNILGSGSFGVIYKGTWNNTILAIKKIKNDAPEEEDNYCYSFNNALKQLLNEINLLHSLSHENIISLLAYSVNRNIAYLAYAFMENGSLQSQLLLRKEFEPLNWRQRYNIACGVARGISYLHGNSIVHVDIKSANILLDEKLEPRISDFGLAVKCEPDTYIRVTKAEGTRAYMPHEYIKNNILSDKVDIYSYGVVLFELSTGALAYDNSRLEYKLLKDLVRSTPDEELFSLKDLKAGDDNQIFEKFIEIGKLCTIDMRLHRPDIGLICELLDEDSLQYDSLMTPTSVIDDNVFNKLHLIEF